MVKRILNACCLMLLPLLLEACNSSGSAILGHWEQSVTMRHLYFDGKTAIIEGRKWNGKPAQAGFATEPVWVNKFPYTVIKSAKNEVEIMLTGDKDRWVIKFGDDRKVADYFGYDKDGRMLFRSGLNYIDSKKAP